MKKIFKVQINKRENKGSKLNELLNYILDLNKEEGKEFIASKKGWRISINISRLRETEMREDLALIEEILNIFFNDFLDDFTNELDSVL